MATTLNAGTTTGTSLQITPDTTGAMVIQTSGANAISISSSQVVTLANALPAGSGGTGITSLGTGVATFLGTPSSANLAAAVTDETGSGALVFGTAPTISSPALTGTPTAPTAAGGTNTTQIATTAFTTTAISTAIAAALPSGVITMWSGSIAAIPSGWYLCDGTNGTPDLRSRFVVGAGSAYAVGATGGSADAIVVSHTHSINDPGHSHVYTSADGAAGTNMGGPIYRNPSAVTSTSTTGITINSTGSSGTGANLPPYYALCYIMKA